MDGKLYVWPFLLDVIVEAQNNAYQRGRPPRQNPGGLG